MTSLAERERIIGNIEQACRSGAALHRACQIAGVSLNCWYRWQQDSTVLPDLRPETPRGDPANKLSVQARSEILAVCNSVRFGSLPPSQIVPLLADEGRYLASESSFYRVSRQAAQAYHRGRGQSLVPRPNRPATPPQRRASGPGMSPGCPAP
jgi:putative transposase